MITKPCKCEQGLSKTSFRVLRMQRTFKKLFYLKEIRRKIPKSRNLSILVPHAFGIGL